MKVSVIGAGYVGLTAAACLSRSGHEVICGEVSHAFAIRGAGWAELSSGHENRQ